jgi:hypothetical protein
VKWISTSLWFKGVRNTLVTHSLHILLSHGVRFIFGGRHPYERGVCNQCVTDIFLALLYDLYDKSLLKCRNKIISILKYLGRPHPM